MTTPVNEVNGIGPKTVEFLKRRRVTTIEALVKRGASVLETAPGFSPGRAANVLKVATALLDGTYVTKKKTVSKAKTKVKTKPEKSVKKDKKKDKKQKKKDKDKKSKNKKEKDKKKDKKNKKDKKKNKKNKK